MAIRINRNSITLEVDDRVDALVTHTGQAHGFPWPVIVFSLARCSRLGLIWGNVPGGGARPQVKRALATLSGQCRSGLRASGSSGGRSRRFRG